MGIIPILIFENGDTPDFDFETGIVPIFFGDHPEIAFDRKKRGLEKREHPEIMKMSHSSFILKVVWPVSVHSGMGKQGRSLAEMSKGCAVLRCWGVAAGGGG